MGNTQTTETVDDRLQKEEDSFIRKLETSYKLLEDFWQRDQSRSFQVFFPSHIPIGKPLYKKCVDSQHLQDERQISTEDFISFAKHMLKLTNPREQLEFYFDVFTSQQLLSKQAFSELLQVCHSLEAPDDVGEGGREGLDQLLLQAMTSSLFGKESTVNQGEFVCWCTRQCPRMLSTLHPYVYAALCGDKLPQSKTKTAALSGGAEANHTSPTVMESVLNGTRLLSISLLWSLNCYLPLSYTSAVDCRDDTSSKSHRLLDILEDTGLQILYDSNSDGLSINRFETHVLAYSGVTITLLQLEGYIYCLGSDTEWREKTERWGASDCFLLQVSPQYQLMLSGSQLLYLNIQDRKYPKGIQVGKDSRTTFLNINEDFMTAKHYGIDIPLQRIEVWGCGNQSVYEAQLGQKKWEHSEADRNKNRKLKLEDWKDNPDRQLLNMGGVATEHAQR